MKIVMDVLFFIVIILYTYRFITVLVKLKKEKIFPINKEDADSIKKYPGKPLYEPTYTGQWPAILIHSVLLIFITIMFILGAFFSMFNWTLYLLIFLPIANSYQLFNLFAVLDDGILSGSQFIRWKRIKSYQFSPINVNHRFYGYSKDVNDGYEFKINIKLMTTSVAITSLVTKEKLERLLNKYTNGREIIRE